MRPAVANSEQPDTSAATPKVEVLPPLESDDAGSLSLLEVIREAFDSLMANRGRALLTMLGVIIGVGSVVSLMALGAGASASVTGQVQSIGTNLIFISPAMPRSGGPGMSGIPQTLTIDDAKAIEGLNLPVAGLAPQFNGNAQIVAAAADRQSQIVGTTVPYFGLNDLRLASGSFFTEAQERAAEPVAVLGANLAKHLFGTGRAVGQTIRVRDQTVRVVGVLLPKGGSGFGSTDDQAFMPISFVQRRLFGARTPDGNSFRVGAIMLSAVESSDIEAIQDRIAALLRERHRLKPDGTTDDFLIVNQASFLSVLNNITSLLTAFLAAIAGISLLVGGIGIMNIMLVSVTERTKEIGLRKAVGARGRDILLQFVVEAVVISLLGGLLGLALGALVALAVNLSGIIPASVSVESVLLAVGFSMAVGLFFGIYPARRAAQLNPIDALRYE